MKSTKKPAIQPTDLERAVSGVNDRLGHAQEQLAEIEARIRALEAKKEIRAAAREIWPSLPIAKGPVKKAKP